MPQNRAREQWQGNDGDSLYENDEFLLYYNLRSPYIGLVRKLSHFNAA